MLFSCQPEASSFKAEFSVRDSLKTSTITVEVADLDPAIDPIAAVAYWSVWYDQDQQSEQLDFVTPGRNSFEVSQNIIRSYKLIYDQKFYDLLVRPGEDLTVQFVRDTLNGGYRLRAPDAPFTDQAAEIYEVIAPPNFDTILALTEGIKDLDSLNAVYHDVAEQRRRRLDHLWATGKYTDPLLLEYANGYIDHQINYFFYQDVMMADKSLDPDSLRYRYYRQYADKLLPQPVIFNDELIDILYSEQSTITRPAYWAAKHLEGAERRAAYYTGSIRLIDSLYDGFLHDFFLNCVYSNQLSVTDPAPTLMADAERFARTTPYPIFRDPLRKQLSILKGEIIPINRYHQEMQKIPEGMDNPIPDILAQHAGKVIVLDFWATWCSPCVDEMKNHYPTFMKRYDPEQLAVIFLAESSPENIWRDQISQLEFSATHLRMNKEQTRIVRQLFGISGIPHHTIFDQNGKLVKTKASGPGYGLAAEIDKLLK